MSDYDVIQGQRKPILYDQLSYDDGTHPNLTNLTVQFVAHLASGKIIKREAVVDQAVEALVRFEPEAADTAESGEGFWNWLVETNDGDMSFPTDGFYTITIHPNLESASGIVFYRPSTREVATVLMARTADKYGNKIGDFTDTTAVSYNQAQTAIDEAVEEVKEQIGSDIPLDQIGPARRLVTFLAAANIEMSFYPEQASQSNSMYDKLLDRVKDFRTQLSIEVTEEELESEIPISQGNFPASGNWGRRPL